MISRPTLRAAALAISLSVAVPAHAAVFAQFLPDTDKADFKWVNKGTGGDFISITNTGSTSPQAAAVHFDYLDPGLSTLGFLPAAFTLTSDSPSGNPAMPSCCGLLAQLDIGGSFSFIYTGPTMTVGSITLHHDLTNLLSGVFTGAWIQGAGNSGSANLTAGPGSVTFSSDLQSFTHDKPGSGEFAYNLLSVSPGFGAKPGKALNTFTANGGGNFSIVAIPEPASWALMILGFGGLGVALRRQRRMAAA
jgi:hypothetical protein